MKNDKNDNRAESGDCQKLAAAIVEMVLSKKSPTVLTLPTIFRKAKIKPKTARHSIEAAVKVAMDRLQGPPLYFVAAQYVAAYKARTLQCETNLNKFLCIGYGKKKAAVVVAYGNDPVYEAWREQRIKMVAGGIEPSEVVKLLQVSNTMPEVKSWLALSAGGDGLND